MVLLAALSPVRWGAAPHTARTGRNLSKSYLLLAAYGRRVEPKGRAALWVANDIRVGTTARSGLRLARCLRYGTTCRHSAWSAHTGGAARNRSPLALPLATAV